MFSLDTLNELQRKIAMDTNGAKLVTAGAGSGKTRLLTHRICYLIDEKNPNCKGYENSKLFKEHFLLI